MVRKEQFGVREKAKLTKTTKINKFTKSKINAKRFVLFRYVHAIFLIIKMFPKITGGESFEKRQLIYISHVIMIMGSNNQY